MSNEITIGSCFAGIGGFELGLERGILNSKTIWQIEQNKYCQTILQKHWPDATIYDDIREIDYEKIQSVDIVCGGFPCQDISAAGKGKGIEHGDRSGLWRQMHRLINHLQPRVAVLENVPALLWKNRGMHIVLQDLAQIGYDAEWCTISAKQFGAPHLRKRVFVVAYPNVKRCNSRQHHERQHKNNLDKERQTSKNQQQRCEWVSRPGTFCETTTNTMQIRPRQDGQQQSHQIDRDRQQICTKSQELQTQYINCQPSQIQQTEHQNYWQTFPTQPSLRHRDDGLSNRLARLRALGNAIVPQCSEYIGKKIQQSNLLD